MDEVTKLGLITDICKRVSSGLPNISEWQAFWLINAIAQGGDRKVKFSRGSRIVSALKKDPVLWNNLQPYMSNAYKECVCKHSGFHHEESTVDERYEFTGRCNYIIRGEEHNTACTCKKFEQRPL